MILDGAIGTELIDVVGRTARRSTSTCGASRAILDSPAARRGGPPPLRRGRLRRDLDRHLGPADGGARGGPTLCDAGTRPVHWMDVARQRRAARARARPTRPGAATRSRSRSASTATSTRPTGARRSGCWRGRSRTSRPDLILMETLSLVRSSTYRDGRARCSRPGSRCGSASAAAGTGSAASTASTGAGPRATRSAAPRGASRRSASARCSINCVPPDHVTGMVSWLRDFTDLPLGVYPNLGYLSSGGWRS